MASAKGGLDDIVLTYDENGDVIHRYLHGPAIDQVFADESTVDGLLWALSDRQGTVKDWVDYDAGTNTTSVYNHVEFDSFGNIESQSNAANEITIGYTDPTTGLQWNRGRWYDPNTGRWLSEDPIGFAGGDVNLSRYVGNGAPNGVDPSGQVDLWWWWYEKRGGKDFNFNDYDKMEEKIKNAQATQEAIDTLFNRAFAKVLDIAKSKGPGASGSGSLGKMSTLARFAGGTASKVWGAFFEGVAEQTAGFDGFFGDIGPGTPLIRNTSPYALGDSEIIGTGTYRWSSGPLTTRTSYWSDRSKRLGCDIVRVSIGFKVSVTITFNFSLSDSFKEPYRVTNGSIGQGIETGMPYKIFGSLGNDTRSRTFWVERNSFLTTDCDYR